jgi:hypothetical protein
VAIPEIIVALLLEDNFNDACPRDVVEKQLLDFNSILGRQERPGVYMTRVDGTPIYSAKCPGCKRIHGNFRTWEEASGNRMCKGCVADFVDKTIKANETGKYKPLLKDKK